MGTDWLVRLVSPRVTRRPRGDSANVKLNIEITRLLTSENPPMTIGMNPPNAASPTSNTTNKMIAAMVNSSGNSHSADSRNPTTRRCAGMMASGRSCVPRSVKALAAAELWVSLIDARCPWARVSR